LATIDYGLGEQEIRCTYRTLTIYEHEFRDKDGEPADLIADVMGKVRISVEDTGFEFNEDGSISAVIYDYTRDNWNAQKRALWAMLRTAERIAKKNGTPCTPVPDFEAWDESLLECEPDLREVSLAVANELQRGLFRAGAAASGKTSEEEA
jgi:hypothetical protein